MKRSELKIIIESVITEGKWTDFIFDVKSEINDKDLIEFLTANEDLIHDEMYKLVKHPKFKKIARKLNIQTNDLSSIISDKYEDSYY